MQLSKLSKDELTKLSAELEKKYKDCVSAGLSLDMTRGKPSADQLNICKDLLSMPGEKDFKTSCGTDARNYGGLDGFDEAKELFSGLLEVNASDTIIGGNASLTLMHDTIVQALVHGVPDGNGPWIGQKPKFICPVPGYDRHFAICEHMGIEMISVEMDENGPNMDKVEEIVANDASVKGMWCVPKYSNPSGAVYSDEVVTRLAGMKTAAKDFRIWCDNAYGVHHLDGKIAPLKNMLEACKEAGNPNRVYMFASTSKISFAGSGVSIMAASPQNLANTRKHLSIQTIGPDKINILRHVRFFKNMDGILSVMNSHAELLKPKFDAIQEIFEKKLAGKEIATWSNPKGGYFVSLDVLDGCATEVVKLANQAGVKLTSAGATYPNKKDPKDKNIRLAPSLPPLSEVKTAMEIVALCILLAGVKKLLS